MPSDYTNRHPFSLACSALVAGKRVRRPHWREDVFIQRAPKEVQPNVPADKPEYRHFYFNARGEWHSEAAFHSADLEAIDWEILE